MKLFHQIQLIKQSSSPCCGHCFQETGKRKGQALLSELHGQVSKWLGQGAKKVDRNKMPRALHQDSGAGEIIICWGHQESLPGQGDVWGEPCRMGRFPHAALIRGVCVYWGGGVWILVAWPRIEPGPSIMKVQSPNHWTTKEFHISHLLNSLISWWTFE